MSKPAIKSACLIFVIAILLVGVPANSASSPLNPPGSPHSFESSTTSAKIELAGHMGGPATAVARRGNYAYLASNFELAILDIADPAHPQRVGYVTYPFANTGAEEIALAGDNACIASGNGGLQIIDISDPSHPAYRSSVTDLGDVRAVDALGQYAYPLAWYSPAGEAAFSDTIPATQTRYPSNIMWVIDISDPGHPINLGSYKPDPITYFYDIAVSEGYAYILDYSGLQVIDVTDPSNPVQADSLDLERSESIDIAGDYAYVTSRDGRFNVIDISDPAHPFLSGVLGQPQNEPWALDNVRVLGSYAYIAGEQWDPNRSAWMKRIFVVAISDPSQPGLIGRMDTFENTLIYDIAVDEGSPHLVTANRWYGWRIIEVSDPAKPVEVGAYMPPPESTGVAVSDRLAYVATKLSGMRIIDITNPASPHLLGAYDEVGSGSYPQDIALAGNHAYVAAWKELWALDVSDPGHIRKVSTYPMDQVDRVVVTGQSLYAMDSKGLHVLDITHPRRLTEVYLFEDAIRDITIVGSYAYTFKMSQPGLLILDISKPKTPREVGYLPGDYLGLAVSGSYAYLVDIDNNLRVVDISRPQQPTQVGFLSLPLGDHYPHRPYRSMAVGGNFVYITRIDGIHITEVSDPAHPRDLGNYYKAMPASAVAAAGEDIYLADDTGLSILRMSFSISGRITDGSHVPVPDVTLTLGPSQSAATDADGFYSFDRLSAGSYTITPASAGMLFLPPSGSITLPSDPSSVQNFIALPEPVSATLTPGIPATLTYSDIQGNPTQLIIPGSAITQTTTLTLAPAIAWDISDQAFAGHAFDILASRNNISIPNLTFNTPVTVTIQYSDQDIRVITDENELTLQWWNGAAWVDATSTCTSPQPYHREVSSNHLSLTICRVGRFALFGPTHLLWLPIMDEF